MSKSKRDLAIYAANRHLRAYRVHPDPRHLANAWLDFRKAGIASDEDMLRVVDQLARDVLDPPETKGRPMVNPVRDMELDRVVRALQAHQPDQIKPSKGAYRTVAEAEGMTVAQLKEKIKRVRRTK